MYFIDTHIHLQDYKSINATDIIAKAKILNIKKLICVSAEEKDWPNVTQFFNAYPDVVVPAFGIHPWYVNNTLPDWQDRLCSLLRQYPCSLVGECGIDGYKPFMEQQIETFKFQSDLAKKLHRPLIVHAVKSQSFFEKSWHLLPEKFVIHSYNGNLEFLKQIIKHNGYIGLSASILKNKNIKELLSNIPHNKLLLETDGPYQSLHQGSEAYTWFIIEQLQRLEQITGYPMAEQIYQNSLEFIKC